MMKILYDNQVFCWQKFGGISRYFYELIKNLDNDIIPEFPIYLSNNHYIANKDISSHFHFFPNTEFRKKFGIISRVNKLAFRIGNKKNIDIVHPTYYDPYFLKYIGNKPFVLTVYDMIHEKYPDLFVKDPTTHHKPLLCQKATKIIAISENTKKDLINIWDIKPEKIEVIYLGQSFNLANAQKVDLPDRYILYTGQRNLYKNFTRCAKAFAKIAENNKDLKFICTGQPFSKEELTLFENLKISNLVQHLFVNDNQLVTLYKHAQLFVFPSEYEGFGIPILEAFASGCPIALSNTSCFPEIAGNAGLYFDPIDVDSIVAAMQQLLNSESLREELIAKGFLQLRKFSWTKMAKETCLLYKNMNR
ncbi:mannosyltransferase [Bacteroidia bacterium]|nr:mannosyltransferase [Bacteroidia bacterium]